MNNIKVKVCKCEQCKFVKNKRKNRRSRKVIKRWLNKKRRKSKDGEIHTFVWA